MVEEHVNKMGDYILLVAIVLIALIVAVIWIYPLVSGKGGITTQGSFETECQKWWSADPNCGVESKPDTFDASCDKAYGGDDNLCQRICQNNCNPYGLEGE